MTTVTLWDRSQSTTRRTAAAQAFLLRALSRPLVAKGLDPNAAHQQVKERCPWIERVTIQKGSPPMSAWRTIQELAQMKIAKGTAPTLAQAIDRVVVEHPALWRQYRAEPAPALPAPPAPRPVEKSAAYLTLEGIAKRYVAEGVCPTVAQGIDRAYLQRPDLAARCLRGE